jgi:hypothetical protein
MIVAVRCVCRCVVYELGCFDEVVEKSNGKRRQRNRYIASVSVISHDASTADQGNDY